MSTDGKLTFVLVLQLLTLSIVLWDVIQRFILVLGVAVALAVVMLTVVWGLAMTERSLESSGE